MSIWISQHQLQSSRFPQQLQKSQFAFSNSHPLTLGADRLSQYIPGAAVYRTVVGDKEREKSESSKTREKSEHHEGEREGERRKKKVRKVLAKSSRSPKKGLESGRGGG